MFENRFHFSLFFIFFAVTICIHTEICTPTGTKYRPYHSTYQPIGFHRLALLLNAVEQLSLIWNNQADRMGTGPWRAALTKSNERKRKKLRSQPAAFSLVPFTSAARRCRYTRCHLIIRPVIQETDDDDGKLGRCPPAVQFVVQLPSRVAQ